MSADHDRLDALRRLAKDRAATPAEKASARRLAKALAAKIAKRPRRSRRRGHGPALPEPPAARWRRRWVIWLGAALHKIAVAGRWLYGIWIVSAIGMVLIAMLGSDPVRRQVGEVYFGRILALVAVALVIVAAVVLFKFVAWWLKTWRSERLRSALLFLTEHGWLVMIAAGIGVTVYLEGRFKWPTLLTSAINWALMFAIGIPWWRWVYPAIERVLLRASHGALRAGVAALAIAVTVSASGGVWVRLPPRRAHASRVRGSGARCPRRPARHASL
jgi:uncharacterized membrane protein